MLKRSVTAFVGIAIAICVLVFAYTPLYPLTVAALIVIALYELLKAADCLQFKVHSIGCCIYGVVIPFVRYYLADIHWQYLLSTLFGLLMFAGYVGDHKKLPFTKLSSMFVFTYGVTLSLSGLVTIYKISPEHGISYVVITLASAWLSDAGAYFVGTFFGKHKLCPDISPKKTIEGAVGGVISNILILCLYCFGYCWFMAGRGHAFTVNYAAVVTVGAITSILGIVGDLTASLLKREHDIKDYGNIMPGHGGVMDRFDSVLFITPFMSMFLAYFGLFH